MIWIPIAILLLVLINWLFTRRIEAKHPPGGMHYRSSAGQRLHYLTLGESNQEVGTLVMVHGASSNLEDFNSSIAPGLARFFRVILIDRPGCGHSSRKPGSWPDPAEQAAVIQELLESLGVRQPVLVGHSWAASLVMAHLVHYPNMAKAAVLIAPATHSWDGPSALYNRISRLPGVGWLFCWTLVPPLGALMLDSGIRSVFSPGAVPAGYRQAAAIALILRPKSWRANADDLCLLNGYLKQQEHRYREVGQPLLAIIGKDDSIVLNDIHVGGLSRQGVDLEVRAHDQTGHAPHHAHVDDTIAAIRRFINRL